MQYQKQFLTQGKVSSCAASVTMFYTTGFALPQSPDGQWARAPLIPLLSWVLAEIIGISAAHFTNVEPGCLVQKMFQVQAVVFLEVNKDANDARC